MTGQAMRVAARAGAGVTWRRWWPWLLVLGAALLPVLAAQVPPLLDYHNHLARQYILARADGSDALAQWYRTSWHAAPYLAFDGIVQAFARLVPVDVAGKIFLVLMFGLLAAAPLALSQAVNGRVTPVALLGLLFVYNDTVRLGFTNYLFGIGFALCAAALWIRWRTGPVLSRLLFFPLLCSLVFFSHLLGFVLYVLVIGSYEFGRWFDDARQPGGGWRWRLGRDQRLNLASIALQCALPLAIFAAFGPSTESITRNTYGGLARKFGLLLGAPGYLMPPVLWSFDRVLQVALPLTLLALLVSRRWRIDPAMRWPLAALLLLFFAMPMELFSGWGADHRLLPALGLLLMGSMRPAAVAPGGGRGRVERWALVLAALLVMVRVAAVADQWRKSNPVYAEYLQALELVPDGSRMYFAFGHAGGQNIGAYPVYHLPTLVLARRDVYVPFLFATDSGGFTLAYRKEVEPWQRLSPGPVLLNGASPDWAALSGRFDYYLLVDERYFRDPVPASLSPVFQGKSVKLYRASAAAAPR